MKRPNLQSVVTKPSSGLQYPANLVHGGGGGCLKLQKWCFINLVRKEFLDFNTELKAYAHLFRHISKARNYALDKVCDTFLGLDRTMSGITLTMTS